MLTALMPHMTFSDSTPGAGSATLVQGAMQGKTARQMVVAQRDAELNQSTAALQGMMHGSRMCMLVVLPT